MPSFLKMLEKFGVIRSQNVVDTEPMIHEYQIIDKTKLEQIIKEDELKNPKDLSVSKDVSVNKKETEEQKKETQEQKNEAEEKKQLELREFKLQSSYVSLDEIQKDYTDFENIEFPEMELCFIKTLLIYFANLYHDPEEEDSFYYETFSEMLFDDEYDIKKRVELAELQYDDRKSMEEKARQSELEAEIKELSGKYCSYIDSQKIWQLKEKIQDNIDPESDFAPLFNAFIYKNSHRDRSVPFYHFYMLASHPLISQGLYQKIFQSQKDRKDLKLNKKPQWIDKMIYKKVIQDLKDQIIRSCALTIVIYEKNINLDDLFDRASYLGIDFLIKEVFTENFRIKQQFPLLDDVLLKQMLQNEYSQENSRDQKIDTYSLKNAIENEIKAIKERESKITQIGQALILKSLTFDSMFYNVLGLKNLENEKININQLKNILDIIKFKISQEELETFFRSFIKGKSSDETIYAIEILKEAQRLKIAVEVKEKTQAMLDTRKKNKNQTRTFKNVPEILKFMGNRIEENKMYDFGSLLKGADFDEIDKIEHSDFFRILQDLSGFKDQIEYGQVVQGIKEGDIIDLIKHFDEKNSKVDLRQFKAEIDDWIQDTKFHIQLKSKLIEKVFEPVVEQIDQDDILISDEKLTQKPEYLKIVVIDIFSGLIQAGKEFQEHFSAELREEDEFKINLNQFTNSLNLLNVKNWKKYSQNLFKYLLQQQTQIYGQKLKDLQEFDDDDDIEDQKLQLVQKIKTSYLEIDQVFKILSEEIQGYYYFAEQQNLIEKILEIIVIESHKKQIPILDNLNLISERYFLEEGQDTQEKLGIPLQTFKNTIFDEVLKIDDKITDNMKYILFENIDKFVHEQLRDQIDISSIIYIDIDCFLYELEIAEQRLQESNKEITFFRTQEEIDVFNESKQQSKKIEQKQKDKKIKKGVTSEPIYLVRSEFNTYLTKEERQQLQAPKINPQMESARLFKDIMMRTRSHGMSVEAYFQQFGKLTANGLTELTYENFRKAILGLKLSWAQDQQILLLVEKAMEFEIDEDEQGTLSLQEISVAVLDAVDRNIVFFENSILERTYGHIVQNGEFKQLKDLMTYLNFNRDYSCSQQQFIRIFRDNFRMVAADINDWEIDFIMQRYADNQSKENRVYYYQMIKGFGQRNKGIQFYEFKWNQIVENLFKRMQLSKPSANLSFDRWLFENDRLSPEYYTGQEFLNACHSIQLTQYFSQIEILQLAYVASQRSQKQVVQSVPDNYESLLAMRYGRNELSEGMQIFFAKSLRQLFQDTLNNIFLKCKKQGLSQSILTLFSDIDKTDGKEETHVSSIQFIQALSTVVFSGISPSERPLLELEAEFLSIKYRSLNANSPESYDRVYYKFFYDDFQELEKKGLSEMLDGIQWQQPSAGENIDDGLYSFQIPQKFISFYDQISDWTVKRLKTNDLIAQLVYYDKEKKGFLSNKQFDDCFKKIGMGLSKKQVGQITYPLHQNLNGNFYYPELILLLYGEARWENVKLTHGLDLKVGKIQTGKRETGQEIRLAPRFKIQLEFHYKDLLDISNQISFGSGMLGFEDFQTCFKKLQLITNRTDTDAIKAYFKNFAEKLNNTVLMKNFFEFHNITDRLYQRMNQIKDFIRSSSEISLKANKSLSQDELTFEDFVIFFQQIGYDMKLVDNQIQNSIQSGIYLDDKQYIVKPEDFSKHYKDLLDIFEALRENKPLLLKKKILQSFEIIKINIRTDSKPRIDKQKEDETKKKAEDQKKQKEREINEKAKSFLQTAGKDKAKNDIIVNRFIKFVQENKLRIQKIQNIKNRYLSYLDFKMLISQIKFMPEKQEETLKILCKEFDNGKGQEISISRLKRKLDIREDQSPRPDLQTEKIQESKEDSEEIINDEFNWEPASFTPRLRDLILNLSKFFKQNGYKSSSQFLKAVQAKNLDYNQFVNTIEKIKIKITGKANRESIIDKQITKQNLQIIFKGIFNISYEDEKSKKIMTGDILQKIIEFENYFLKKITDSLDGDTLTRLDLQIDRLFRKVDIDHSGKVNAQELYQLLKPLKIGSILDCSQAISRIDFNNDSELNQEEFHQLVKTHLLHTFSHHQFPTEDYKFIISQAFPHKQLSPDQLNEVIFKIIKVQNVDNDCFLKFVSFLNADEDQFVQLDYFMQMIKNCGQLCLTTFDDDDWDRKEYNRKVFKMLYELRQAMSVNLFHFYSSFVDFKLPPFFEPSFLQDLLEKQRSNMPSYGLFYNEKSVRLEQKIDLKDVQEIQKIQLRQELYLRLLISDVQNVPMPLSFAQENFQEDIILGRELRVILYDSLVDQYVGNCYIVPAVGKGSKWVFSELACLNCLQSLIFRRENNGNLQVIFEFVITLRDSKRDGNHFQITNCWASVQVSELYRISQLNQKKQENQILIDLLCGSPQNPLPVDLNYLQKPVASKQPGLSVLFGNNQNPVQQFSLKVSVFPINQVDFGSFDILSYYHLPKNYIICSEVLDLILAIKIIEDRQNILQNKIQKIFDNTDTKVIMQELWIEYFSYKANSKMGLIDDKKLGVDEKVQFIVNQLIELVQILYSKDINHVYATRSSKIIMDKNQLKVGENFDQLRTKIQEKVLNKLKKVQESGQLEKKVSLGLVELNKKQEEYRKQGKEIIQKQNQEGEGTLFYENSEFEHGFNLFEEINFQ